MNILPLLLFAVLLGGDNLYSIKDFLSKIDFPSFAPVLRLLGFNNSVIEFLCSEKFNQLLSSNVDAKSLLPLLSSLFTSHNQKNDEPKSEQSEPCKNDYLSAIKNVAPTDIEETLNEILN